ncbi:ATPase family AAA domain-containing protein [Paramyrothecium foliicola]|nr:ATPase family AAA domain-containing protein [Paramyrothecium foliicola]
MEGATAASTTTVLSPMSLPKETLGETQPKQYAAQAQDAGSTIDAKPTTGTDEPNLIKRKIEYVGRESGSYAIDLDNMKPGHADDLDEPLVLEHVEVRLSGQSVLSTNVDDITKTEQGIGHSYINLISPPLIEALRCIVDYFPDIDFSGKTIKILEPYSVFTFYEEQLTEYRERLLKAVGEEPLTCSNKWAAKHIGIAQDFVKKYTQEAVKAEKERHARGYVTFDMLWLLFKPGSDVYYDIHNLGEHEPYVVKNVDFSIVNGTTNTYSIGVWNMDADSNYVGPMESALTIERFAGEKEIISLQTYPCEYLRFSEDVNDEDLELIKKHFIQRGKKWFNIRRKSRSYYFDGHTITFPRRSFSSLAMVDSIQYPLWEGVERRVLSGPVAHPASPVKICHCARCEELIYKRAVKPKFAGYSHINPLTVESLTDHQYLLCDQMVEAFLFKTRSWQLLHIDGFNEPSYDNSLFSRLVMKESTKQLIKSLTQSYIREHGDTTASAKTFTRVTQVHKARTQKKVDSAWSADFIEGKGEGLTILLHGRPGVGKTYTAECIAEHTGRPLLSLTCSDIGVKPEVIEDNLRKWFKLAENWGTIMLIDEADIYMEHREVQDLERNHLVAGFLRALEYYKGILFLTTNRVGTFDEAFISRIHVQIYYPELDDEERDKLWDIFFRKLEDDRETTMRITQSAKDYVQSHELRSLRWNGREIRNAFQVAVALAAAQNQKDKAGRILIQSDHLKATVQMSKEFHEYLVKVHRGDLSKKASITGTRYDAYGKDAARPEK